jgi:predicted transcriptional regulator YdeE
MKIIEREAFHICGYAIETNAEQNERDSSQLYKDFFESDKESVLRALHNSKKGYYGLLWYTEGHEKYCYLLGIEVAGENRPPENAILKTAPETTYAVACYPYDKDGIEAWTEFFYSDIPNEGYTVNEQLNFYFEYYPESADGDYELWVPVMKATVS